MQSLHIAVPSACDPTRKYCQGVVDTGIQFMLFDVGRRAQHKTWYLRAMTGMIDAQAQAVKNIQIPATGENVEESIVSAMAPAFLAFHHAGRQVQLIMSDQDFLGGNAIEPGKGGDSLATAVHESGGDE